MAKKPIENVTFQDMTEMLDKYLPNYLANKHAKDGGSSWNKGTDRLYYVSSILSGNLPISEIVLEKNPEDLERQQKEVLCAALYEFLDWIEETCKKNYKAATFYLTTAPITPENSICYQTVAACLGMFDTKKIKLIPENRPGLEEQKKLFEKYKHFWNEIAYIDGDSANGYRDSDLRPSEVEINEVLIRLGRRLSTIEEGCNNNVKAAEQKSLENKEKYTRITEKLEADERLAKENPEGAFGRFWKSPFSTGKDASTPAPTLKN